MKKLVFGLIATVVFSSMSYGQEFKSLYTNFKNSTEIFYLRLNDFDKNLNVEVEDLSVFKSEESFRQWLRENITKTNYKDAEQAIKDYNEQINLATEIINNNYIFLKRLRVIMRNF
jgi:hypothetical protein